jgi:hypothetical protein
MGFADRLDSIDLRHHLLSRVGIIVLRPLNSPGRGDPRVVYSPDHDTDPGALAVWKFRFQDVLLHQGISERDEKEIEPERVEKSRDHSDFVDAGSDAAHETVCAQQFERSPSGTEELSA